MEMQKAMKELGPCAEVVKRTMMDCFFVLEDVVKKSMEQYGEITAEAAQSGGVASGNCYE
jgi:hypothetical protein